MIVDLNNKIPHFGHIEWRATEAIKYLDLTGDWKGAFEHNGIDLIVYRDSTPREICYQYDYNLLLSRNKK